MNQPVWSVDADEHSPIASAANLHAEGNVENDECISCWQGQHAILIVYTDKYMGEPACSRSVLRAGGRRELNPLPGKYHAGAAPYLRLDTSAKLGRRGLALPQVSQGR